MGDGYKCQAQGAGCHLVDDCVPIPINEEDRNEQYADLNVSQNNSALESSNGGYMDSGLGISVCQGSSYEIGYSEDRKTTGGYCFWCYIFVLLISFIAIIVIIQDYVQRWI